MGEAEFEKKSRSRFMTHTDDSLWLNMTHYDSLWLNMTHMTDYDSL